MTRLAATLAAVLGLMAITAPAARSQEAFKVSSAVIASAPPAQTNTYKLMPPASGVYLSAFPAFGPAEDTVTTRHIDSFVGKVAGKGLTWAYFSDNWFDGIGFPRPAVDTIRSRGIIPFIRIMPRSTWESCSDRKYSLDKIITGRFDGQLRRYAQAAAAVPGPLMMEFGTEVNGDWFPWSGSCNGGGKLDGYGAPDHADGPERFRDAYRHLIDIFRAEGANNVTWVMHYSGGSSPEEPWNSHAAYYPGDGYIDWIGLSAYGAQTPAGLRGDNPSFRQVMDEAYARAAAVSAVKPIAVLEFGVVESRGKAQWIRAALDDLRSGRYPRVKAAAWWHSDWQNDDGSWSRMKITSSRAALAAYRAGVSDPAFITSPTIAR